MATSIQRVVTTITSGSGTSSAVAVPQNTTPLAIVTPSALTNTAFTFEVSDDGGTTYRAVYKEGTQYSVNVGTSRHVCLDISALRSVIGGPATAATSIKIVGASNEAATRTLTVVFGVE